jgi:hypothetical protein
MLVQQVLKLFCSNQNWNHPECSLFTILMLRVLFPFEPFQMGYKKLKKSGKVQQDLNLFG